MRLSEALDRISKAYLPGVIRFYQRMKDDPWQKAHDRLEGSMLLNKGAKDYFEQIEISSREFCEECLSLIDKAKPFVDLNQTKVSIPDAFWLGEDRLKELEESTKDLCAQCGSDTQVRMTFKSGHYGIYCGICAPEKI